MSTQNIGKIKTFSILTQGESENISFNFFYLNIGQQLTLFLDGIDGWTEHYSEMSFFNIFGKYCGTLQFPD